MSWGGRCFFLGLLPWALGKTLAPTVTSQRVDLLKYTMKFSSIVRVGLGIGIKIVKS